MRKLFAASLLVALAVAAEARAVTLAWTPVGNAGNTADPATGFGAVGYAYDIGTYDVTVSQYVAFLDAKDPSGANTLGLYNSEMTSGSVGGGVSYNAGGPTGDKYGVVAGDGNLPINYVDFYDTLRFANWLDNGQGNGSTETGAYTLLGGTPTPSNADDIVRNAGATVFLPNENEWYKAAYYNPAGNSYYQFPTSSNTLPTSSVPTATPDSINGSHVVDNLTNVGAYTGTMSPYGAFDMAGNLSQWTEAVASSGFRTVLGSSWLDGPDDARSSNNLESEFQSTAASVVGFRVASISTPEPSAAVLAMIACGTLWWWRKRLP
jgi:formylglycine-generating enzyme